uniref:Methyltransferase FkbM domain-containing protein n=1 Tax=Eubacterium cellulosolvens (strain ATCC 43171 / JCM 9499 / 6) TaxID=633697 RepID=I5AW53_EUBC6
MRKWMDSGMGICNETNIYLYGLGQCSKSFIDWLNGFESDIKIVGALDSFSKEGGNYYGIHIVSIDSLKETDVVVIAIGSIDSVSEIKTRLIYTRGIKEKCIYHYLDFIQEVRKKRIIEKYQKENREEYREVIEFLKAGNPLTVRNLYANPNKTEYRVFRDDRIPYPYINYLGKKLYLPSDFPFEKDYDGNPIVINIVENDQYDNSPHLYMKENHQFKGGVLIDAGVAEGNFALKYVDNADKIFLIESDKKWLNVLQYTFAPYKDKVIIVPKRLGRKDNREEITIDSIIGDNECDFIKMDIEGSEPDALLGGIETLRKNNIKLSICAYHQRYDEKYIRFILESLGYDTEVSHGFMFFQHDDDIDISLDFRRGIVYGKKNKRET